MANISFMDALTRVSRTVKTYVDRNTLTDDQMNTVLTEVFGNSNTPVVGTKFSDILSSTSVWQVFGDSISTTYNISENQIWHNLITADSTYSGITKYNNSLTGSEVSDGGRDIDSFIERYTSLNSNATLVTIFAGVNDWCHNNIPLGNYNDTTTSQSFYGALNTLLPGVKAQCPNARIIWLSPLKTKSGMAVESTNSDGTNAFGLYLTDYIQAIKYKCHQYDVEFINLYGVAGLDPDVNTGNFQSDGLHLNASGQAALKNYLVNTAEASVPDDVYGAIQYPATATFTSLHSSSTAYFCVVVDVSELQDGDTVVASWTGSEQSVWGSWDNYSDPWYCTTSELQNIDNLSDSRVAKKGNYTALDGDLLSGTSTTTISSPGSEYKYLRIQIPIGSPNIGGSWTITNMTVTANGTTELPVLNMGGFFTDSNIVMTYGGAN